MSRPDLGLTPAGGSRLTPSSSQPVTFADLPVGYSVHVLVGSTLGDSDVHGETVVTPAGITLAVPATGPLYGSAFVTLGGSTWSYVWSWGVGAGSRAQAQVEHEVYAYLASHWKRSELSAYAEGIAIPDPGHGNDEISPVTYNGWPFDVNKAAHVAPFTTDQVANQANGTGYLRAEVRPLRAPEVVSPDGDSPVLREEVALEVTVITPADVGVDLANLYWGAVAMLFRGVTFKPSESGITTIRNIEPPPERPRFAGTDGTWQHYVGGIILRRTYRGKLAGDQ